MTAVGRDSAVRDLDRALRPLPFPSRATKPMAVLILLCLAAAPVHLYLSRAWVPFGDEVGWASQFEHLASGTLGTWFNWFDPLGRFTYNVLFATFGIDSYPPFGMLALICNLILVASVYVYCAHIERRWCGVILAAFLLMFGNGVHSLLYGLNSLNALGIATLPISLVLLGRNNDLSDRVAFGILLIGLGFDGPVVVAVCVGLAVWLAGRSPWQMRCLWIPGVPILVYAIAVVLLPEYGVTPRLPLFDNLLRSPRFALEAASGVGAAILGIDTRWGPAVLATAVVCVVAASPKLDAAARRRVVALGTAALAIWALLALARAHNGDPDTSRYLVLGAVPALLAGAEISKGRRAAVGAVLAALLTAGAAANLGILFEYSKAIAVQSEIERAHVTALDLAGERAPADYRSASGPSASVMFVDAGGWRRVRERLGSFGFTEAEAHQASELSRGELDRVMHELGGIAVTGRKGVLVFPSMPGCLSSQGSPVEMVLGPSGTDIAPTGGEHVEINFRRFGANFGLVAPMAAIPEVTTRLVARNDGWETPWQIRVTGSFLACPASN